MNAMPEQIDAWIDAVIEDQADAVVWQQLNDVLIDNPEAQRHYLERVDLHHAMAWQVLSDETHQAWRKAADVRKTHEAAAMPVTGRIGPMFRFAAAAVVMLGAVLGLMQMGRLLSHSPMMPPADHGAPTFATVVDGAGTFVSNQRLGTGAWLLERGVLRVIFDGGAVLSVQGPAKLKVHNGHHVEMMKGVVLLSTEASDRSFVLETAQARLIESGTEIGVRVDDRGAMRASVLRGEVRAEISGRHVGMMQAMTLTRDDGLRIDAHGAITSAIVGDDAAFTVLRSTQIAAPVIANAGFEYPRVTRQVGVAAAGWTMLSHPVANADSLHVEAGLVSAIEDADVPAPLEGRQWAYLQASTFADGRTAHNSLHQSVGVIEHDTTYRLQLRAGWPARQALRAELTVALYAGSSMHGPEDALRVWRRSPGDEVVPFDVTYHVPLHSPYRSKPLFVVIEAVPGAEPGTRRVFVDDVRLELLSKEVTR